MSTAERMASSDAMQQRRIPQYDGQSRNKKNSIYLLDLRYYGLTAQKSAVLIYFAAEACNHALYIQIVVLCE